MNCKPMGPLGPPVRVISLWRCGEMISGKPPWGKRLLLGGSSLSPEIVWSGISGEL